MSKPPDDLIYSPAKRRNSGLMLMFSGPSGSGKTKSALRVATGLANGGPILGCDTEHGRMLHYADDFEFLHLELKEPFNPLKFERAAVSALNAKAAVWICDSFTHEHVGPGGLLDMFEAELQRMVPDNEWAKREACKMAAWIKPKGEHKHLLQRLWQLNMHIILCCHADKKIQMVQVTEKGRTKTKPTDAGYQPICGSDIPYAMTASFIFDAKRPGVPTWLKHFDKLDGLIDLDGQMDENTGRRLGAWARGEKPEPINQPRRRPPPGASSSFPFPSMPVPTEELPPDRFDDPPAPGGTPQGLPEKAPSLPPGQPDTPKEGLPESGQGLLAGLPEQKPKAGGKTEQTLSELIAGFEAVTTRAEHLAIVDQKANRDRIAWLKKNRPEMHAQLDLAMKASWKRTDQKDAA